MKKLPYVFIGFGVLLVVSIKLLSDLSLKKGTDKIQLHDKWVLAIPIKISGLNPQKISDSIEKGIMSILFSRLVKVDESFDIKADLVESWNFNIKNKKYTMNLKKDVFFHDGSKLTSEDVVFSMHVWSEKDSLDSNLLLPIKGVADYRDGKSKSISGIKIIDAHTFEIHLNALVDNFILTLTTPRFFIYPKNFANFSRDAFFISPIGTGPYKVLSIENDMFSFAAFDKYHEGKPKTKNIVIKTLDPMTAVDSFLKKEINDLIYYDDADVRLGEQLKNNSDIIVKKIDSYKVEAIIFNLDSNVIFKEKRNRELIRSRIPVEEIVSKCYPGENAAHSIIPIGLIGSEATLSDVPVKPVVDWNSSTDSPVKGVTLRISTDQNATCISKIVSKHLHELGVKVEASKFSDLFSLFMSKKLEIWTEKFTFKSEDPFSILQYFSKDSNEYLIGGNFPELNQLFSQLNHVKTLEERASIYRDIDDHLINNSLVIPLVYYPTKIILRKNITGVQFAGNRHYISNWHTIGIAK